MIDSRVGEMIAGNLFTTNGTGSIAIVTPSGTSSYFTLSGTSLFIKLASNYYWGPYNYDFFITLIEK